MNIIFLDVDGVLNSLSNLIDMCNRTKKSYSGYNYPFDKKCLKNLKILVESTDSKIVVSSTWRKNTIGREKLLRVYGLDQYVIGYTPVLNGIREYEIKEFLAMFKEDVNFIILDDDSDMGELMSYLVKTDRLVGLTSEDVLKGVKKLIKKRVL